MALFTTTLEQRRLDGLHLTLRQMAATLARCGGMACDFDPALLGPTTMTTKKNASQHLTSLTTRAKTEASVLLGLIDEGHYTVTKALTQARDAIDAVLNGDVPADLLDEKVARSASNYLAGMAALLAGAPSESEEG